VWIVWMGVVKEKQVPITSKDAEGGILCSGRESPNGAGDDEGVRSRRVSNSSG